MRDTKDIHGKRQRQNAAGPLIKALTAYVDDGVASIRDLEDKWRRFCIEVGKQ